MHEPTNSELQAEVSRLTRELGLERMGKPSEQPLIDVPLDRQIVLLNRQIEQIRLELLGILELFKDKVIVREGNGEVNVIASLAVTASKYSRYTPRPQKIRITNP